MTDTAAQPDAERPAKRPRRPVWPRVLGWVVGVLVALVALVAIAAVAIDTAPGHRLLVRIIEKQRPANGLTIRIGRLDGSIYKRLTVRDLAVGDLRGVFATSSSITLDWRPLELLHKHVLVEALASPRIEVLRAPALRKGPPPKPNQPLIPDIHLTLNRLDFDRVVLGPALTGDRRAVGLHGSVRLLHGRAQVDVHAQALEADGHAGGDRLSLMLDAQPSANRLLVDAHLMAPQGGVVDRLAKLNAPLTFDLDGRGTWAEWNGRALATLGGRPLLTTAIAARSGVVSLKGTAQPSLVVKAGPVAALTAPALAFDLTGKLQDRQLDGTARIGSDALDVNAKGRLDLARSAFRAVVVDARLLKPQAASPKLNGRDVRAHLSLNGAFARPVVDYDIAAAEIGFDKTIVQALHASGKARVDANTTIRLPVHATAERVVGLPEAAGGLTTHVRIDGDVVITPKQIASDNLHIRSDRLDATLVLALSLDTGRYDAALKGRINRYEIKGLGVVDLVTDAKLVPTGKGEFRIAGHVHVATLRIDNKDALDFLGGQAVIDTDFSRSPDGVFAFDNLRLHAPKFRILDGRGTYRADGRVEVTANAVSDAYGPLHLSVGGTVKNPQVRLVADNPKIAGITGLNVQLVGMGPEGFHVTAQGNSQYGPITADVVLHPGKGALQADIRRASIDGINVTGSVRQTPEGPFAGVLRLAGSGLTGTATLGAQGKVQRVVLALRANDARLPLQPPVTIARGVIDATALLYPGAPQVTARATLSGVRRGELLVADARAAVDYRGGNGRVTLQASGRSGVPFSVAADVGLAPDIYRIGLQGVVNKIPLRLAEPAVIRKVGTDFVLSPTTLLLQGGRVDLSGRFGKTNTLQARLQNLDLSLVQAFAPNLGVNGAASGVVDATLPSGGATPTVRAQLQVARFTRSGLTTVSEPVDLALLATLNPGGAEAHALVRRRGAVIGRLQARLAPIPTGGAPWFKRIASSPITGGLRYNGPAETLWALSGISGQELSGPIAIGADVSGRWERPSITGVIRADALRYENATTGTVLDHIAIGGRFAGTRLQLDKLTANAGKGTLTGSGYADLSSANGFPIDLNFTLKNAQLAKSDDLGATASGTLAITNSAAKGALISGDITVDQARYAIAKQGASQVVDLEGVHRKGDGKSVREEALAAEAAAKAKTTSGPPSAFKLNIKVHAPNRIFVSGMGLEAEWSSDLAITGEAKHPLIVGDVSLVRGTFSFAGRELTLSRGTIHLDGASPPNPTLDIEASTTVEGVTATIDIAGTALHPQISFTSTPVLPQDEVLSRLLFGASVTQLSPIQALQLAAALNSLRGGSGGLNPLGKLRSAAGLDRLRFYGADKTSGRGPSVGAGKYISSNIYVEVTTDARGFTATQIEIGLTKSLRLLSQVGSFGGSNLKLRYSHDY